MHCGENKSARVSLLFLCLFVFTSAVQALQSISSDVLRYRRLMEETDDPNMMLLILSKLGKTIWPNDVENSKRGLDLGLSRGYSGSQQAKHMMGIAAAGLSGGPGRRRRSQDTYRYEIPY